MIFVDTNVFVIDLRYREDRAYRENRRFLERVRKRKTGATGLINVLETCGILSFNLSPQQLVELFTHFARRYEIAILPEGEWTSRLPSPTAREVLEMMRHRMSLKDAEIALLAGEHASQVEAFVTWNAKHFTGKLPVLVMTPRAWLAAPRRARRP